MRDRLTTTRYSIARACRWHALACIILLLTGCKEHLPSPDEGRDNTFCLTLTISTGQREQTRADLPGDPGKDPTLAAPTYVYVWAEPTLVKGGKTLMMQKFILQPTEWTWDNTLGCYRLNALVKFDCGKREMTPNTGIPIYALASRLNLKGLIGQDFLQEETTTKSTDELKQMEWDLSTLQTAWQTNSARELSNALRDLYSTPIALESDQQLTTDETGFVNSPGGTIRLYHCAAKVDMKWEVAVYDAEGAKDYDATLALQQQTAVESITLSSLPTKLRVFAPTENPTGTATTCTLLSPDATSVEQTTPGNRWIGRAVAYVLQPAVPAPIPYEVTFSNPSGTGTVKAAVSSQTPEATNTSFTTWFRVNAQIKK